MITKNITLAASMSLLLFSTSSVLAGSVIFSDNDWNFPGYAWTNGSFEDEEGTPKIDSMSVSWDENSGLLETVSINHRTNEFQSFDSLFINVDYQPNSDGSFNSNSWDNWDYFVHSGGTDNLYYNGNLTTSGELPADGLYSVDTPETYLYTTNISNGRTDHPNGIDSRSLSLVDGSFTRHTDTLNKALIYDFTGLNLQLTDSFAFAYAPWCANDIITGTYTADPVPEPATMLLFGSGLLGLAGLRRKIK